MKHLAIYAGTFDPITYGHIDIAKRASRLFDQVIVAIAASPAKNTLFTLSERVTLATQILKKLPNITVRGFDTLTLECAKKWRANILIRGLRAVADFDYELQLANMNRTLYPKMETMFLMPAEKYLFISSSLIREIASLNGDITPFVPPLIVKAVKKKLSLHQ